VTGKALNLSVSETTRDSLTRRELPTPEKDSPVCN